uniref:Uncharacterized protein n=1 Tax=Chaetoceros debilis TaxID=122233 RepID=A0A7S3Q9Z1_9STRA
MWKCISTLGLETEKDGPDNEIDHGFTLPMQCRAPCADSQQKTIAELVVGHTVFQCDTNQKNLTNSTNSCICKPEEMALKWMIEEDNYYTFNEVDHAVSKTFLMERFLLAAF